MFKLQNLKVVYKLFIIIGFAVLALLSIGYTGYHYLNDANDTIDSMYKDSLLPVMWLNDNRNQARAIEGGIFDLMITTDDSGKARLLNDINKRIEIFNNNLEAYEKTKLRIF